MSRPAASSAISGIVSVNKPLGITSMEVVRRIKRASGVKRVGHAGTLDPDAAGVLPVCIGQATRVVEYLIDSGKEYLGEILLGVTTDTYDAAGKVTAESDPSDAAAVTVDMLESVLADFAKRDTQRPPMFSALKKDGKRLYDLARQGIEVEREARPVVVNDVALESWSPPIARIRVRCGRGYYMRSLAHDIGQELGCGGHLSSLVRTAVGPFALDDAISLDEAAQGFEDGSWRSFVSASDSALGSLRACILGEDHCILIRNGRPLPAHIAPEPNDHAERIRAYSADGGFVAILRFDGERGQWLPDKVFAAPL